MTPASFMARWTDATHLNLTTSSVDGGVAVFVNAGAALRPAIEAALASIASVFLRPNMLVPAVVVVGHCFV